MFPDVTATLLQGHLRIPYTGARAEALFLTSNKLLAKKTLQASGLGVPGTGSCTVAVQVSASGAGPHVNTIPAGGIT